MRGTTVECTTKDKIWVPGTTYVERLIAFFFYRASNKVSMQNTT